MRPVINRFNIRVYLVIVDLKQSRLLVADEIIRGKFYTKFPGGGLEFGESLVECAEREAVEEFGQPVRIIDHFYTTDFFVQSAFNHSDQVISVYYLAELFDAPAFRIASQKFDFLQSDKNEESFRWTNIENLASEEFAFPADKVVVEKIRERFRS